MINFIACAAVAVSFANPVAPDETRVLTTSYNLNEYMMWEQKMLPRGLSTVVSVSGRNVTVSVTGNKQLVDEFEANFKRFQGDTQQFTVKCQIMHEDRIVSAPTVMTLGGRPCMVTSSYQQRDFHVYVTPTMVNGQISLSLSCGYVDKANSAKIVSFGGIGAKSTITFEKNGDSIEAVAKDGQSGKTRIKVIDMSDLEVEKAVRVQMTDADWSALEKLRIEVSAIAVKAD